MSLLVCRSHRIDVGNLKRESVIVDAGACRGDFSKFIRSKLPNSDIYAIEAQIPNIKHLSKIKGIDVLHSVLMGQNCPDDVVFYEYVGKPGKGSAYEKHNDDRFPKFKNVRPYNVKCIRINDIFTSLGLDEIDYLKLDIECAEHDIFNTMTMETAKRIHQLSMEVHLIPGVDKDFLSVSNLLMDRLTHLGYTYKFFEDERELWAIRK